MMWTVPRNNYSVFKSTALASCLPPVFTRLLQLQRKCELQGCVHSVTVSDVYAGKRHCGYGCWQKQHGWPNIQHEVRCAASGGSLLYKKGLMWEPLGGAPVVYTTIPLDCKVGKHWFQAVSLPDEWNISEGSINLISWKATANAPQKTHFGKKPSAQSFHWQCGTILWTMLLTEFMHLLMTNHMTEAFHVSKYQWWRCASTTGMWGNKCIWHNRFLWWQGHGRTSFTNPARLHQHGTLFEEHRPCIVPSAYPHPLLIFRVFIRCHRG